MTAQLIDRGSGLSPCLLVCFLRGMAIPYDKHGFSFPRRCIMEATFSELTATQLSKRERLLAILRSLESAAVAFSGGIDSTVVAKAAH